MTVLGILVWLIVGMVLAWAADRLMGAFGVADPLRTVILVALVLAMLLSFMKGANLPPFGPLR